MEGLRITQTGNTAVTEPSAELLERIFLEVGGREAEWHILEGVTREGDGGSQWREPEVTKADFHRHFRRAG